MLTNLLWEIAFTLLLGFSPAWLPTTFYQEQRVLEQVNSRDLQQRVARLRTVEMPCPCSGLSDRERKMVEKLVEGSRELENIFWRQNDPQGLQLYTSLAKADKPELKLLRRLLFVNAGRFDMFDANKPFVGNKPMPPGRGLYNPDITREQLERYAKEHPDKKAEIYSPHTVIELRNGLIQAVPYHVAYSAFVEPAAQRLREAADLSDDAAFAKFLRLRADALLKDDYYASDLAWLDLKQPKFDVIFAPYETYLDDLLGVKTSYGAAVLIRDEAESAKIAVFQKYVPDLQDALPLPAEDRPSKRGLLTPMEVMNAPFRAADLRHGYQAVADNLPNDPRIHQQKGSKKIFFKNFMDARVRYIIVPLAQRLLRPDQAAQVTPEGYLSDTLSHEISHGLGPAFARVNGKQVDVREAIGPSYAGLEEAKADVVGQLNLKWLADKGAVPKERLPEYYASHVADTFRTVRFGLAEAHSRSNIIQFNFMIEQNAVRWDPTSGRYTIDYQAMPAAVAKLARELLIMEATGDRARVEQWFKKYAVMPESLQKALLAVSDVPVDVDPVFSFREEAR